MGDTTYEPASAFGWLDYDERDAQRMREVLAAFDEKQTVDSLGFGIIRDSFSDQLNPGTTTIQTRARYFLLVPWAFLLLESERVAAGDLGQRLRDVEARTIDALHGVGASQGVIGVRKGAKTQRLASVVYWNGLGTYGIRLHDVSMDQYRQSVGLLARQRQRLERDDDHGVLGAVPRFWDAHLPLIPDGFPDAPTTLDLTADEALYLANRIQWACAGTFIASIVADPVLIHDAALPWDVPSASLPDNVNLLLRHGRCFSELVYGAQLLYNLLLCAHSERDLGAAPADVAESMRAELADWAAMIDARRPDLEKWFAGLDEFWPIAQWRSTVGAPTKRFVTEWCRLALSDPHAIADNPAARALVINREHQLKGRLARLAERRALETWNGEPFGIGQLSYRWAVTKRHVADIAAGLAS